MRRPGLYPPRLRRAGQTTADIFSIGSGLTLSAAGVLSNDLITGKAGGQTVTGGTAAGESLTLQSTTDPVKGNVYIGAALTVFVNGVAGNPRLNVDGTGLTTTVPALFKNGKQNSGVEVQVTGAQPSGFVLNDSAGTGRGRFGIAANANDWISGTAASDVVLVGDATKKLHLGAFAGSAPVMSLDLSNGRVGIGVAPTSTLHIGGVTSPEVFVKSNSTAGAADILLDNSAATARGLFSVYGSAASGTAFGINLQTVVGLFSFGGTAPLLVGTLVNADVILGANNVEQARLKAGVGFRMTAARHQAAKGADVAAAGTLTLGADGNFFVITGNTNIDFITTTNWQAGSMVVLQFTGTPTVNHNTAAPPGGTAAILLAGAANFGATASDTLTLVYNGTNWCEVARTVI